MCDACMHVRACGVFPLSVPSQLFWYFGLYAFVHHAVIVCDFFLSVHVGITTHYKNAPALSLCVYTHTYVSMCVFFWQRG